MAEVAPHSGARWARAPWWAATAALVLHAAGLWGGYTFDDFAAVLGHPAVTGEAPLAEVFSREYWGRPLGVGWSSSYRPVTTLTFALSHRLTPAPWLHHLVNLLLYSGLCALVVAFLRRHVSAGQALAAGMLFAVWPIHVENVASIVGRADVLAAGLALLALWWADACVAAPRPAFDQAAGVQRADQPGDPGDPQLAGAPAWPRVVALSLGAALAYLLALLSKEAVALLPGVAAWFLVVRWRRGALPHAQRLAGLAPVVALSLMGLGYLAFRQTRLPVGLPAGFVDADNILRTLHGPLRWWANLSLLGTYGEIATVPARLCVDHTYGDVMPPAGTGLSVLLAWRPWLGVALVGAVCVDAWRAWRGRSAGLGVAFALTYLLVGQWLIDLSVTFAERLFLWPSVFAAGAVAALIGPVVARQPLGARRRLFAGLLVIGALYAARTVDRSLDWRTPLSLYRSSARACPAAVHNRLSLAKAWQHAGRPDEALWNYAIALAGHRAFPAPFAPKAFAVEHVEPLASRLCRLPTLLDLGGTSAELWPAMARWLDQRGARAEAALARQLASEARP